MERSVPAAKNAKRKGHQVIENKRFREIADFSHHNDFNSIGAGSRNVSFRWAKWTVRLFGRYVSSAPETQRGPLSGASDQVLEADVEDQKVAQKRS